MCLIISQWLDPAMDPNKVFSSFLLRHLHTFRASIPFDRLGYIPMTTLANMIPYIPWERVQDIYSSFPDEAAGEWGFCASDNYVCFAVRHRLPEGDFIVSLPVL
jgi:hypothetical protein